MSRNLVIGLVAAVMLGASFAAHAEDARVDFTEQAHDRAKAEAKVQDRSELKLAPRVNLESRTNVGLTEGQLQDSAKQKVPTVMSLIGAQHASVMNALAEPTVNTDFGQCLKTSGVATLRGSEIQLFSELQSQNIIGRYECLNKLNHEDAIKVLAMDSAVRNALGNTNATVASGSQLLAAGHAFINSFKDKFRYTQLAAANRAVLLCSGVHAKDPCYETAPICRGIISAAAQLGVTPENAQLFN